ncbi:SNF2-related protein [Conchiformibius steedae]|uniref:SNF2-related protein n=1 Tax=Conchiformibius steedae TaxID=153493 RepID=UPI0026F36855|nr:SNF2-related protein [Conchiformibius steedae]
MNSMVEVKVVHDGDHAVLADINGRQQWLPRDAVSPYLTADGTLLLPPPLAAKLGADTPRRRQAYDLDWLLAEHTLSGSLNIRPQPNRPPQQAAFDKLYRLDRFALLMQMRAGKSKVAIDIVCHHYANGHIDRVLWLCPNSATATAEAQWRKFAALDVPRQITALETVSGCGIKRLADIMAWFTPRCAVIIDESQMMKNDRARRSQRLQRLCERAAVVGILSGTPVTRNIQDLYNQVRLLDWRIFGYRNRYQFNQNHLIMSEHIPGLIRDTKNVAYLADRFKPFMFEWFDDYGTYTRATVEIPMSPTQRELYEAIKDAVLYRIASYTERPDELYLLFTALQSVLSGYVSARLMRRIFGKAARARSLPTPKLDWLVDYVGALDEPVIVWCTRRHELHSIVAKLPDAIAVSGEMDAAERHRRITRFRGAKRGVLVAMVQVAKRAIEMSECNEVIYYGHSFDYESREQSKWRTLLPEKTDTVRYTDLIYRASLDERILTAHAKKRSVVREFLDLLKTDRTAAIKQLEKL